MAEDPFIERLRTLVGRDCCYFGRDCRIVEVLPETDSAPGQLVLEAFDSVPPIQPDQFGQAVSRANEHIEVPIQTGDGEFTEEMMHLLDSLETRSGC